MDVPPHDNFIFFSGGGLIEKEDLREEAPGDRSGQNSCRGELW